jgi:hypothetical protein
MRHQAPPFTSCKRVTSSIINYFDQRWSSWRQRRRQHDLVLMMGLLQGAPRPRTQQIPAKPGAARQGLPRARSVCHNDAVTKLIYQCLASSQASETDTVSTRFAAARQIQTEGKERHAPLAVARRPPISFHRQQPICVRDSSPARCCNFPARTGPPKSGMTGLYIVCGSLGGKFFEIIRSAVDNTFGLCAGEVLRIGVTGGTEVTLADKEFGSRFRC